MIDNEQDKNDKTRHVDTKGQTLLWQIVAAGSCWCRKMVAGEGLVAAGGCWCRNVIAGVGLVAADAKPVVAGAGR